MQKCTYETCYNYVLLVLEYVYYERNIDIYSFSSVIETHLKKWSNWEFAKYICGYHIKLRVKDTAEGEGEMVWLIQISWETIRCYSYLNSVSLFLYIHFVLLSVPLQNFFSIFKTTYQKIAHASSLQVCMIPV